MDHSQRIEMLERLAGLHRAGNLTDSEYAAEKARLLSAGEANVAALAELEEEGDEVFSGFRFATDEEEIDRFRGSTAGWLFGSLAGWGTILLCILPLIALLAQLERWPLWLSMAASLIGFGAIGLRYLRNLAAFYVLTTQRLILRTGILFKRVDEIELFRVKDARVDFSLVNQLTGIGRITLRTSDPSSEQVEFVMRDVPDAQDVRETLRTLVDKARRRRGVRELDIDSWD